MMTASRALYVLLSLGIVPFLLSSRWPALADFGFVYDALVVAILIADFNLTQSPHFLTALRAVSDRLSIGRMNDVALTIYNQGMSSLFCRVKDDSPKTIESDTSAFEFQLKAQSKAVLAYRLLPRRRGSYQFGHINIAYLSRLRLFWRQFTIPANRPVKVFSDLKGLHDLSVKLSHSTELGDRHQRRRGQGTEFAGLKEYTSGDDCRAIDWKATARKDRPVLRTYEAEQEQVLLIAIDAGRMMVSDLEGLTRFDHALNAALCLALAGLTRNDQVGLGVFADRPLLYLPPRRGKAQLKKMIEAVFDLQPRMIEPDYLGNLAYFANAQKGRSLMVVLTDLTDPSGSQMLLTGLGNLSPRHLPFCVTLQDRQVEQLCQQSSSSIEVIYRKAVATDLLVQRELALSVLTRRGCLVLDCPPQMLSGKLVDQYLEIKARGRL